MLLFKGCDASSQGMCMWGTISGLTDNSECSYENIGLALLALLITLSVYMKTWLENSQEYLTFHIPKTHVCEQNSAYGYLTGL